MTENVSAKFPYENTRPGPAYPRSNPPDPATADDWRWLRGMAIAAHGARYPDRLRRLGAAISTVLNELECPRIVFRPANDSGAWWIGHEGRAQLFLGAPHPRALSAAHQAIGGAQIPAAALVRGGSKQIANAARNQLQRVSVWVREVAECPPLAEALGGLGVRSGLIVYQEPDFPLTILR